jgi:hypothetical protein
MKAFFAAQLDCEYVFSKRKKVILEGGSYGRAALHGFFAIAGQLGRSVHEVNDCFGTIGVLRCTLQSGA